jgi:hypothetical protein
VERQIRVRHRASSGRNRHNDVVKRLIGVVSNDEHPRYESGGEQDDRGKSGHETTWILTCSSILRKGARIRKFLESGLQDCGTTSEEDEGETLMASAVTALPPEIQIEEGLDGVRYILGRRPSAHQRAGCAGIPVMLFGIVFSGFSLLWMTMALVMSQSVEGPPVLRWLFPLFGTPFFIAGQAMMGVGLYLIRGRAEISIHGGKLSAIKRAGPYRWTTSRPIDSIVRLQAGSTARIQTGFGQRGVKVVCESGTPMVFAVGYPLDWQEALALAVAERIGLAVESVSSRRALDGDTEFGPSGEVSLKAVLPHRRSNVQLNAPQYGTPSGTSRRSVVALGIVAVAWNGITWGIITAFALGDDSDKPIIAFVILGVFALVGLLIIVFVVKTVLARAKLHPGTATASVHPICLGEALTIHFAQQPKSTIDVTRVSMKLLCRESATYRQGTNTYTKTHDVHTDERDVVGPQAGDSFSVLEGAETFQIPPEGMHSFEASHNQVTWLIETKTELAGWPDYAQYFELEIAPLRIAETRGGNHADSS